MSDNLACGFLALFPVLKKGTIHLFMLCLFITSIELGLGSKYLQTLLPPISLQVLKL